MRQIKIYIIISKQKTSFLVEDCSHTHSDGLTATNMNKTANINRLTSSVCHMTMREC